MRHILIVACVLSIFSSFSQQTVALETQLTLKENKFYSNEKPFTGQIISLFENGQQKSMVEVKDGVPNGKIIEYLFDKRFQKKNYQDSVEIRKFNKLISEKKAEIELNIQDTIKASKEEKDFLNYEIGGFDKLAKLKEKNDEGKLNKKKKAEFDKYEVLVQEKNKALRKLKDAHQALNELNLNLKGETSKSIYFPKKAKEYEQINSIKEGKATLYDSLGNKFGEGNYSNGKQNGEWIYYYPNGKIQGNGIFLNGNETDFGSSGIPRNGREGVWIFYYSENGNKNSECNYKSGKMEGKYIEYYSNGKIQQQGEYISGKKNGLFILYNSEGIKTNESYYEDGKKNGVEKEYYGKGNLKAERNFKMGKNHGKARTYYESGNIEVEADIQNGKQHGTMISYYENGKIQLKANYDTTSLAEKNFIGDVYQYNEDGSLKFHGYAHKDGRLEDKTISNAKTNTNASLGEIKKTYKCKCCKATINGLQEGVDKNGGEFNETETTDAPFKMMGYGGKDDFYQKLGFGSEENYYRTLGFDGIYDYLRKEKYKFCTMKCARTCFESNSNNHIKPIGY